MKKILLLLLLVNVSQAFAQFDITKYTEYLDAHKDMSYQNLLEEYPAGVFRDSLNYDFLSSEYGSELNKKFDLTAYERQLLNRNGFMVTDRQRFINFQQAYYQIYNMDMPAYVSADAILHAFHYSWDKIFTQFEENLCQANIYSFSKFFNDMHKTLSSLKLHSGRKIYLKALQDMDLYFAVPSMLFSDSLSPFPVFETNKSVAKELLADVQKQTLLDYKLFSDSVYRKIDFSQFKPRGHYTQSELLEKYFKMMIWFGRTDIYITKPGQQSASYLPTDSDIDRQTMLSALISKTIMESDIADSTNTMSAFYEKVNGLIDALMGYKDNLTITDIYGVMQENNITDISQLEDVQVMEDFREDLLKLNSSHQLYSSHILISNPMNPEQAETPAIFMLFGQAPTIDNFITANVVYDRILYKNEKVKRMLPSTLDVLFAMGNDAAIQLLSNDLQKYNYASNLAAARYLIDTYEGDFWNKSYYTLWLNAIKSMNPPKDRSNLPEFMQTAAWQQKNMNTQLASWIELRHDFILYTKQAYTGMLACDFPYSYVEPVPGVYENLQTAMENLSSFSKKWNLNYYDYFFQKWISVCENLKSISIKELNNEKLNEADTTFLKQMLNYEKGCVDSYIEGWFAELFYRYSIAIEGKYGSVSIKNLPSECLTADFHTAPTDEFGDEKGYVMHGGTGLLNLAIVTARTPDGKLRSYAGPVMSYYETTTLGFQRLTDEEWDTLLTGNTLGRPQICNLYLANKNGAELKNKISLLTYTQPSGIEETENSITMETFSYPNPFKGIVNIMVKLPMNIDGHTLKLEISSLEGNAVSSMEYAGVSGGNFQLQWDGKDSRGNTLPAGTYLYRLSCGNTYITGKIIKE